MSDKTLKNSKIREAPRINSSKLAQRQINWFEQPDDEKVFGAHGPRLIDGEVGLRTITQRVALTPLTTGLSTGGSITAAAPEMVTVPIVTASPLVTDAAAQAPTRPRQRRGLYQPRTNRPDFWFDPSPSDDEEDQLLKIARRAARENRRVTRRQTLTCRTNDNHSDSDEMEQKTTQWVGSDYRLAKLMEKEPLDLQGCDTNVSENVENNEDFTTCPPSQYLNSNSDIDNGARKNSSKKKKYHRAITDTSVVRNMAKIGEPQPEMCRITYKTEVETKRGNGKWIHQGDIVEMVYGRIVFWDNKESIKALNAWRYQIFNRNFDNLRTSRLPWTVQEMEYVYELLQAQFGRGRRRIAWNRLANNFNRHFNGVHQEAGARVLKQSQKIPEIKEERLVPYRSGKAIETACYKDDGAKVIMKAAKTTIGYVNSDPDAEDNPDSEASGEAQYESEDEDMLPNLNPLTIAAWAPKPNHPPKAKVDGESGKDKGKLVTSASDSEDNAGDKPGSDADVNSDDEPLTRMGKSKKATPRKRKRGESDRNLEEGQLAKKAAGKKGSVNEALAKKAPAKKAVGKMAVVNPEVVASSDESDSDGIPAVAKNSKTTSKTL
ncbi:hypothetical protein BGZ60DRAFT_542111 [Tricladium varicosporioides]|nr:hypothetical protein BGZ60DRAFT_542111 [Hymenoscyphus varicosporioides]